MRPRPATGDAFVEHVDEANLRCGFSARSIARERDRLVVGGFHLSDRLEPEVARAEREHALADNLKDAGLEAPLDARFDDLTLPFDGLESMLQEEKT